MLSTAKSGTTITIFPPSLTTYEEHFIIRFPPSLAASVRADLQESGVPESDKRMARVSFDGRTYAAVLCDLPTIIETHKTTDRSQYVKVADVHQVLIVLDGPAEAVRQKIEAYRAADFKLDDGLSPPMANVRHRRFSKKAQENAKRMEEVDKIVQRLIEADNAAVSSNYVLYNSRNRPIASNQSQDKKKGKVDRSQADSRHAEGEIQPDQESADSDFAAELEDNLLEDFDHAIDEAIDEIDEEDSNDAEDAMDVDSVIESESVHTVEAKQELPAHLLQLQQQIIDKRAQLESVTNPAIRSRLEEVIRYLEEEFAAKLVKQKL